MTTIISMLGIELELLQPAHGVFRYSSRVNLDGGSEDCFAIAERVLCEESTAEILLDLHSGQEASIWNADEGTLICIKMLASGIVLKTVLDVKLRDWVYARKDDICIYVPKTGDAVVVPVAQHGRFRPKKRIAD